MTEKPAPDSKAQTKQEFNIEYGKWLRDIRMEYGLTPENVAEMTGVPTDILHECETGKALELYYLLRLWELYKMD